jgi:spermidine/putrescine transport system substrate-binding protein
MTNRRDFLKATGTAATVVGFPTIFRSAHAARENEMNILCWEGYNSDEVLDPFRKRTGAKVSAESGTSDPDMINKLRAGEINVWDLINVNQPWAREQMFPEGLIKPLNRDRFEKYFDNMMAAFQGPYKWSLDQSGQHLIGMVQRFGPFSFVVNTNKISRQTAEDEGFKLFLDSAMSGRYGVLTYDNWNIMHMCVTADVDPFKVHTEGEMAAYEKAARQIFSGSKLQTDDLVQMNTALVNGEIDAYFTGGTYTASPARFDGETQVRGITPKSGPFGGKGGIVWVEVTSVVNNPNVSPLAEDFLEYAQEPDASKAVAFSEGTYNPVSQMSDPKVFSKFDKDELNAIQWDSLEEELANSTDYGINPDYDKMIEIYNAAKREA